MNTIKKIGGLCTLLTVISSCVTTQTAYLKSSGGKTETEVFMTNLPEQPYEEIIYIEASGSIFHGKKALLKKLKQTAEKESADAIVDVKFSYIPWVAASIPMVEGVAIKYKK